MKPQATPDQKRKHLQNSFQIFLDRISDIESRFTDLRASQDRRESSEDVENLREQIMKRFEDKK